MWLDTNNNLFRITDGQLQTSKKLNVNTHPTASIRISSTDAGGLSFEQQLTITLTDAPDAPTDIELDGNSIKKFERTGTFIGNFSATDSDEDDSHTFHLADKNGTDNDLFFIDEGKLVSNHMFDDSSAVSYKINVEVTDSRSTYQRSSSSVYENTNPGGFLINVTKDPSEVVLLWRVITTKAKM